jgi:hypothetical protein
MRASPRAISIATSSASRTENRRSPSQRASTSPTSSTTRAARRPSRRTASAPATPDPRTAHSMSYSSWTRRNPSAATTSSAGCFTITVAPSASRIVRCTVDRGLTCRVWIARKPGNSCAMLSW